MNLRKDLELSNLEQRKDFYVMYDGDYFGIYKFNLNTNRYEGFGYINLDKMVIAITDNTYFIKARGI